jgi:hypothetical protein
MKPPGTSEIGEHGGPVRRFPLRRDNGRHGWRATEARTGSSSEVGLVPNATEEKFKKQTVLYFLKLVSFSQLESLTSKFSQARK